MNFNIVLTDKEVDYIVNTLAQRPWVEVQGLMANIGQQIQQQQQQPESSVSNFVPRVAPRHGTVE